MPQLTFPLVYTKDNSQSSITQVTLSDFQQESMGGGADPQWNLPFTTSKINVLFSELPANWVGEWHENPQPQWIVPLEGGWWVETQDGKRIELREGEISFGADQHTAPDKNGNKGHRSGSLDGKPCRMIIVQLLDDEYQAAKPAQFS